MRFASFFSGGFITAIVVNPPERKLAKCISVHCSIHCKNNEKVRVLLHTARVHEHNFFVMECLLDSRVIFWPFFFKSPKILSKKPNL